MERDARVRGHHGEVNVISTRHDLISITSDHDGYETDGKTVPIEGKMCMGQYSQAITMRVSSFHLT